MFELSNIETEPKKELFKIVKLNSNQEKFNGHSLDEIFERLEKNSSVLCTLLTKNGVIIKPEKTEAQRSIDNLSVNTLVESVLKLVDSSHRSIKQLDPINEMNFIRINTKKYEIMAAKVNELVLIVVQATK